MSAQSLAKKISSSKKQLPQPTPMMRQYLEIKSQHEDAILFYRLGDFYEMFYDDAVLASQILDLTLTHRNKNQDNPVPLCGVPYHAAEGYLQKLIDAGKKVAICEQTEDPKQAKGIVKREVTRIITPGTVLETQALEANTNNFLLCIVSSAQESYTCALCDVSTGRLEYFEVDDVEQLRDEIVRLQVRELIYPESFRNHSHLKKLIYDHEQIFHQAVSDLYFDSDFSKDTLVNYFKVSDLVSLGLKEESPHVTSLGGLLSYLKDSKILTDDLLSQPAYRALKNTLFLDETSLLHLEIFKTQRDQKRHGTLIWHLDQCCTSMGSRKLADILRNPLLNKEQIEKRLNAVESLLDQSETTELLRERLNEISDLERLSNRFLLGTANGRDAVSLKNSLKQLKTIKDLVSQSRSSLMRDLSDRLQEFSELISKIENTLYDDVPVSVKDGHLIQDQVNAELDELRNIEKSGKGYILELEQKEKERTGISSLKIRYNHVFGYYIEITHTHKDKVPENYIRKQTLTNAERYITDELKEYEAKVLGASERIKILEFEIFTSICQNVISQAQDIKKTANALALIDVLQAFAQVAQKFHYTKPKITEEIYLEFKEARHPILEHLHLGEAFVPNDIIMDALHCSEMIITGPNMAGKSTLMRMVALITILAQIGCYVPCSEATVGACDRIFTRVGAHDYLQKGLSTFMVEMVETAKILREATPRSLILLDEIGRGTSTFDGLSIAWAVAEDLHDRLHARTLFATHYHELCDLEEQRKGIQNFHMAVKEYNGEIIFLRKLKAGGTNRSYGVAVAGMAGLPQPVIKRAKEVLKLLEVKDLSFQNELNNNPNHNQMSLFQNQEDSDIIKQLKGLDVNDLTPLQALTILAELKEKL